MKFCPNCGKELNDGADICLKCGHMINNQNNTNTTSKTNVIGIVGFVVSIIAFFTSFFFVGIIFAIASLILSIIGITSSKKLNNGKGLSIAGLIISIISIVISILMIIAVGAYAITSDEFKEELSKEACQRYGTNYKITNGKNVNGSYDYDEWYCCKEGTAKTKRNCYEID